MIWCHGSLARNGVSPVRATFVRRRQSSRRLEAGSRLRSGATCLRRRKYAPKDVKNSDTDRRRVAIEEPNDATGDGGSEETLGRCTRTVTLAGLPYPDTTIMSAKAAIPLALLLFTPFDAELLDNAEPCISSSFYGNFRDGDKFQSVFIPEGSCIDDWITHQDVQSASVMGASRAIDQLVWVEKKAIDPQLEAQEPWNKADFMAFLDNLSHDDVASDNGQELLAQSTFELLYYSDNAALLSLSSDKALTVDTLMPRFWKSTLLPKEPVRYVPVSSGATARVRDTLSTLQFDPDVAAVVNSISVDQIKNDIRFLTGEDPKSGIISRHSFAEGSRTAAAWLKSRIEDTGAVCELKPFLVGFAPNVVW